MNRSRGNMYFHRLFSVEELGFGRRSPEPFIAPLIRKFLEIGEAVAGRWIEMPFGVLLFQLVPGVPDSGAIYLYDRRQCVFYLLCFDGPDDHLTLDEFEELAEEYKLIQFAEQPGLIAHSQPPVKPNEQLVEIPVMFFLQPVTSDLAPPDLPPPIVKLGEFGLAKPSVRHVWFQNTGTA